MLYPIELWVQPKGTGNCKSTGLTQDVICTRMLQTAPRLVRAHWGGAMGFKRIDFQVQWVPAVLDRADGKVTFPGEAISRTPSLAILNLP